MQSRAGELPSRLGSTSLRYNTPLVRSWLRPRRFPVVDARTALEVGDSADDQEAKLARMEASLFLSREPMSTRKLANVAKLTDGTEARTLLKLLARRYDQRASAIQVV